MKHLTHRWASLRKQAGPSVFVASFLVRCSAAWTPEDFAAEALYAIPEENRLAADASRGSVSSVRIRFLAESEEQAQEWAETAMRDCARRAYGADSLIVRKGRLRPGEAPVV